MFYDNRSVRGKDFLPVDRSKGRIDETLVIRRIDKDQVVRGGAAGTTGESVELCRNFETEERGAIQKLAALQVFENDPRRLIQKIDKDGAFRASGERFDPDRSGPGKEIEDRVSRNIPQDIKDRPLDLIQNRANSVALGTAQNTAFGLSGNDAHDVLIRTTYFKSNLFHFEAIRGRNLSMVTQASPATAIVSQILSGHLGGNKARGIEERETILLRSAHDDLSSLVQGIGRQSIVVRPVQVTETLLGGAQVLFAGCGERLSDGVPELIEEWVFTGGLLVTSDHMVRHLLTYFRDEEGKRFVGQFRNEKTTETMVLDAVFEREKMAPWVVKDGSMPVSIHKPDRVEVLSRSPELGFLYWEADAILLRFSYGAGSVFHMVSHWSSQVSGDPGSHERPPFPHNGNVSMILEGPLSHHPLIG